VVIYDTGEGNRIVGRLVFGLLSASRHASKSWARTKFYQALELVKGEEVLSFDPADRGGKLIRKQLNEDGVCEFLMRR
jgi:hypothetical protein